MNFFLEVIKTRFKLSFNKFFIITIFLYVIFSFITILSYNEPDGNLVKIGFLYEENDFTRNLIEQFEYYSEDFFTVVKYDTQEELELDVIKNIIDCGYILPNEYNIRNNSIEYISSNKTITGTYSNLLISSIYLQNRAPVLGYNVSRKIIDLDEAKIKTKIENINKGYLEEAPFMTYEYRGMGNKEIINTSGVYITLYGIVGLFITLISLIFYLGEVFEENFIIYLNLKNRANRIIYYTGNLLVYFLILLIFGFINILIIKWFFIGTIINLNEIIVLSLFSFMVASSIFTLTLIKNTNFSSLMIIFYFITACIFGNVFIDIGLIFPFISQVKLLYPTYYFKSSILEYNINIVLLYLFIIILINTINYYLIKYLKFKK